MRRKQHCGAYARSTGRPCQAKALVNGRCRNHGGLSTGPKTEEGRRAVGIATQKRMALGQRQRALEGFYRWLEGGGRLILSQKAKVRHRNKKLRRLYGEKA